MNSMIGLKHPDWDLNKSKYAEIDELPLMASIGPVLTILAVYLVFVLKVGPTLMRKREAYKLTTTMVAYNGIQVLFSVVLVYMSLAQLINMGLVPKKCYMQDDSTRNQILLVTYFYFGAKLTELLDTVFFILRKKDNQVTFLHLYHHSIMVIAVWAMLKYWPSQTLMFIGFSNSLVHVFMYTYYGLAALGPNVAKYLTWKKYMTKIQLISKYILQYIFLRCIVSFSLMYNLTVFETLDPSRQVSSVVDHGIVDYQIQFVAIIIQYVAAVCISDCPPSQGVAIFVACNTAFFLVLFLNFYRQSYKQRKVVDTLNLCAPKLVNKRE